METFRVIIAGSRTFDNQGHLFGYMDVWVIRHGYNFEYIEVVSGTARGADTLGEKWAHSHNIPVQRFPAMWEVYGKSAGYLRNKEMAEYATHLVAFWDGKSRGTKHMIDLAREHNLEVEVVRTEGDF